MPAASGQRAFHAAFADGLLLQFPKLTSEIQRDFKWLRSDCFGIVHLGGDSPADLALARRAYAQFAWPGWIRTPGRTRDRRAAIDRGWRCFGQSHVGNRRHVCVELSVYPRPAAISQ